MRLYILVLLCFINFFKDTRGNLIQEIFQKNNLNYGLCG